MKYVPGIGPLGAKIAIVGEAPGRDEEIEGRPFVGASGHLLDELLDEAGLHRSECYLTNVVKYRPPQNNIRDIERIGLKMDQCIEELNKELRSVNPNVIVALGNTALYATASKHGITEYRGSILPYRGGLPKVIPTYHPAHVLRQEGGEISGFWQKYMISFDLRRAAEQSKFREMRLPVRDLRVAKSSLDLYRFLEAHKNKKRVSVDIESVNCIPVCIGLAFNRHAAISVPLYPRIVQTSIHEIGFMWQLVAKVLADPEMQVVGQNFKYDQDKLYRLGFTVKSFWGDTMLMSHVLDPELPQGLAFLTSVWTEEPYYKSEWDEFNVKKDDFNKLLLYNAKDAAVTMEIWEEMEKEAAELGLSDFYRGFQHRLHNLYWGIERLGLRVDEDRRKQLEDKYEGLWEERQKELDELIGWNLNVSSPKQVALALYDELKFPKRVNRNGGPATDEDTLIALLGNHAKTDRQKKCLNLILEVRRIRKTIGTYVCAERDYDGRHRTSIRISGTETGRTSNAILKKPVRPTKCGLAFQTLTKHGDVGSDLRSIFIPDPGMVFVNVDLSQAEARIVALLSDDEATLDLFNKTDIHKMTASFIFNVEMDEVTGDQRFVGKVVRHAGNYGMKKRRLMQEVNSNAKRFHIDLSISEWRAGKILDKFHEFTPKIREVFHKQIQAHLENDRVIINPFGRRRTFYARYGEDLWKEAYAYIPQSTVGDHLKSAMLRLKDEIPDLMILIEAHDAILVQVPKADAELIARKIRQEFMTPIDFSRCTLSRGQLVIPSDVEISETNYKDLRKLKFAA